MGRIGGKVVPRELRSAIGCPATPSSMSPTSRATSTSLRLDHWPHDRTVVAGVTLDRKTAAHLSPLGSGRHGGIYVQSVLAIRSAASWARAGMT
jgi:hypothetical protein